MTCCPQATDAPTRPLTTVADLMAVLDRHSGKTLSFEWPGDQTKRGYHITEIKSGTFAALDCGANEETWSEVFVQLWNVDAADDAPPMTIGKARGILAVVERRLGLDRAARVTFEVSDGNSAIMLMRAAAIQVRDDVVRIALEATPSSCKPRDRWLAGAATDRDIEALARTRPAPAACCSATPQLG